jgi:membrane protein YdbS with pleckstrin-like domain
LDDASLQRLDPAYVRAHLVSHRAFTLILGLASAIGIVIAGFVSQEPGWFLALLGAVALTVTIAIGILGERWVHLTYRYTAYAVGPEGLEIRRGVLWRKIIDVPRSRIQHTDVTQGPLERAFGIATLVLYTAGLEHAKVDLPGLAFETALGLRLELLQGAESGAVDDGAAKVAADDQQID